MWEKTSGPIELYDLENDLSETNNIADKHPDIVEQMKRIMPDARTENEVFRFTRQKN